MHFLGLAHGEIGFAHSHRRRRTRPVRLHRLDEFKRQIDDWMHVFRQTKPTPGIESPLIPGDPERAAQAIRCKEGIPLIKPLVDDLLDISRKTGTPFDKDQKLRSLQK